MLIPVGMRLDPGIRIQSANVSATSSNCSPSNFSRISQGIKLLYFVPSTRPVDPVCRSDSLCPQPLLNACPGALSIHIR